MQKGLLLIFWHIILQSYSQTYLYCSVLVEQLDDTVLKKVISRSISENGPKKKSSKRDLLQGNVT